MDEITIKKCPSCGAANMQEKGENRLHCIQCGANLSLVVKNNNGIKKIFSTVLILLLLSSGAFYYVSNKTEQVLDEMIQSTAPEVAPTVSIQKSLNAIPKLKKNAMTISREQFKHSQDQKSFTDLRVLHKVTAKKESGGQFWIVTVGNQTKNTLTRPRVELKLLNENNEKIESYTAWSKIEALPEGETTSVLIDLPQIPKQEFHSEIIAQSSSVSLYDKKQQLLEVQDFTVSVLDKEQRQFELTGNVYNPFDYQVYFVEIIAFAKDKQGKTVGYAKTYASTTNIKPKQTSSFTLKADKYLTQTPYSWTLRVLAKKH